MLPYFLLTNTELGKMKQDRLPHISSIFHLHLFPLLSNLNYQPWIRGVKYNAE
jgi:hypothetical protein